MAYSDLLSEMLGIDKLRVIRTEIDSAEQITLFVESVEEVAVCPECKQLSNNKRLPNLETQIYAELCFCRQ